MKKLLLLLIVITVQTLYSDEVQEDPLSKYFYYLDMCPNLKNIGNASLGEIQLILDREKIKEIESITHRKAGIIAEDRYWIWINDAVKFPSGVYGIYGRIVWKDSLQFSESFGVAILPVLENASLCLNINYRHATRSWELELPRGALEKGELSYLGAKRELSEETGLMANELIHLGDILPDSGMTNTVVSVFLAKVEEEGKAHPEDSEAIAQIAKFSMLELKAAIEKGYIHRKINGKVQKIHVRDPFLCYALFQINEKGYYE